MSAVFKVWNSMRTVKRSVLASSLPELVQKGCEKLGITDARNIRIVDEQDGTLIDEWDVAIALCNLPFLILQHDEEWTPGVGYKRLPITLGKSTVYDELSEPVSVSVSTDVTFDTYEPLQYDDNDRQDSSSMVNMRIMQSSDRLQSCEHFDSESDTVDRSVAETQGRSFVTSLEDCPFQNIYERTSPYADNYENEYEVLALTAESSCTGNKILTFQRLLGRTFSGFLVSCDTYHNIRPLLPIPRVKGDNASEFINKVIPYLIQQLKLKQLHVLQSEHITDLANSKRFDVNSLRKLVGKKTVQADGPESDRVCLISRVECWTAVLNTIDVMVARDILCSTIANGLSTPFIVADVCRNIFCYLSPLLKGTGISYKICGIEFINALFEDPFSLIIVTRTGSEKCGKSAILNQVFKKEKFFCSSDDCCQYRGEPFFLEGFVEIGVLTEETCKKTVWLKAIKKCYIEQPNQLIILANVHGDSTKLSTTLDYLANFASCFVVFHTHNAAKTTVSVSGVETITVEVDPVDYDEDNLFHLNTSSMNHSELFIDRLCTILTHVIEGRELRSSKRTDNANIGQDVDYISIPETQTLVNYVERNTCKRTKLLLQSFMNLKPKNCRNTFTNVNNPVRKLLVLYLAIVRSQNPTAGMATTVLGAKLHLMSMKESAASRQQLSSLKMRKKNSNAMGVVPAESHQRKTQLDNAIKLATSEVNSRTIGLDCFTQLLRHVFLTCAEMDAEIHEYPRMIANLLSAKYHLELRVNDRDYDQLRWFDDVCMSVGEQLRKQRAVVVSAIGTKSSGKSTLLNKLFGCQFTAINNHDAKCVFEFQSSLTEQPPENDVIIVADVDGLDENNEDGGDDFLINFAMSISDIIVMICTGQNCSELLQRLNAGLTARNVLNFMETVMPRLVVLHLHSKTCTKREVTECCAGFNSGLHSALSLVREVRLFVGADCNDFENARFVQPIEQRFTDHVIEQLSSDRDSDDVTTAAYKKLSRLISNRQFGAEFGKVAVRISGCWARLRKSSELPMISKNLEQLEQFFQRSRSIDDAKREILCSFKTLAAECIPWWPKRFDKQKSTSQTPVKIFHELTSNTNVLTKIATYLRRKMTDLSCHENLKRSLQNFYKKAGAQEVPEFSPFNYVSSLQREAHLKIIHCGWFTSVELREVAKQLIHDDITQYLKNTKSNCYSVSACRVVVDNVLQRLQQSFIGGKKISWQVEMAEALTSCYSQVFGNFTSVYETGISWDEVSTIISRCDNKKQLLMALNDYWLPQRIFKQSDAYFLEIDMVAKVRESVKELLANSNIGLNDAVLVHVWAQRQLYQYAECRHMKISEKNQSLLDELTELTTGSNSIAKGWYYHCISSSAKRKACIENLVYAIKHAVLRYDADKNLSWSSNSDLVRVKYFSRLASDIINGRKATVLHFVQDPETAVSDWYLKELRSCDAVFTNGQKPKLMALFVEELANVTKKLESTKTSEDAVKVIENYCNAHGRTTQSPNDSHDDCSCLRNQLLCKLKSETAELLAFPLSEDSQLCNRLSDICREKCYWCGALCWGKKGHTSEGLWHYTAHQPVGMNKFVNQRTGTLLAHPCNVATDDWDVLTPRNGNFSCTETDEGLLQERVRRTKNWSFETYNETVSKLMQWIFSQIHVDIAESQPDLLPANKGDLRKYGCLDVDAERLLSKIQLSMHSEP